MIGKLEVKEKATLSLAGKEDRKKLLGFIAGKKFLIGLSVIPVVICTDEEGMKLIYDALDENMKPTDADNLKRKLLDNLTVFDESKKVTFGKVSGILSKAGFPADGSADIEIGEHIVQINAPGHFAITDGANSED